MTKDFTLFLWLLKIGTLLNVFFFARTWRFLEGEYDLSIVVPAQILFAVSAYRCSFPNRYEDDVVFHDSVLSSTFVTRVLATFAELAFIYLLSHLIRRLNADHVAWVDLLSWVMVAQVTLSQVFVWGAILTGRLGLYFWEEVGWGVIITANTLASAWLYGTTAPTANQTLLLQLNLLFGLVYLPWQVMHLRALLEDARSHVESIAPIDLSLLSKGLRRSISRRTRSTDSEAWGGIIGLTWMTAYWATLIPIWVYEIVMSSAAV